MKATKLARVLGALLLGGAAFNANAGSWSITPDPATIGTAAGSVSQSIAVAYTGDGATQDAQIDYDFAEASFTVQATAANNGTCNVVTVAGNQFLRVLSSTGSNIPSSPTTFCNVTFTSLSANTDNGTGTPEFSFPAGNTVCGDNMGNPTTCTPSGPIRLDVTTGPQAPTLTFNPAPGPITVNATGAGSIAVTAGAGTAGTSTALSCTSTSGTATVTGSPFAPNSSGSIAVQCAAVVGASNPFTVTCDPVQSAGTDQAAVQFTSTCPALAAPPPEFSATLSATLIGAPATTATGSIAISNTGGSPLTITCGAPTGGFTVTSGPTSPVAAGGSTSIGLSCVTPGAAGAVTTGSLTCTTNDSDEAMVVFALTCSSQVLSVPAMGSFGKGIMIALLAGLGLLGFAMRRRAV